MNRLFSIAVAAILALGAFWFCLSQCVAQTQDGAFDDLKIKEIFVPAWDSQLLPDLSVKTSMYVPSGDVPVSVDKRLPEAEDETPDELKDESLDVPEGETREFYSQKVKNFSDAIKRACPDDSDQSAADKETVLKYAEPLKAAIKGLATFARDGDSAFDPSTLQIDAALTTLRQALAEAGAQDERNALEQDVKNWLEAELDRKDSRRDLTNAYKRVLFFLETDRALDGPEALELGKAKVLRKLLDAELAKERPDEARVRYFRERYNDELVFEFQENPAKRDEILLTALRDEKASPRPQRIVSDYLRARWGADARKLLVEKGDVDGALELALECVDASLETPSPDVFQEVYDSFAAVVAIDSQRGDEKIVETMERYSASDVKDVAQENMNLAQLRKFEGEKPVVEGVCVDGSVLDWNSFRGKPTILVLCESNSFQDPVFRNAYDLLKLFADSEEANILTYTADDVPDLWKPFEAQTPWKTVSKKLTLDAQDKKYRELTNSFGFRIVRSKALSENRYVPRFILFDSEGVVVKNLGPDCAAFETFLSEIYSNFFETAYRSVIELFDVPDDKNRAFYEQRLQALGQAETTIFNSLNSHREPNYEQALKQMEQKRADAVERALKLAVFRPEDDRSIDDAKKNALINEYANRIVNREDRAAVVELLNFENAKANPNMGLVSNFRNKLIQWDVSDAKADPEQAAENLRKMRAARRGEKQIELASQQSQFDLQWENNLTYELLNADIQNGLRKDDEQGMKEALDQCLADAADVPSGLPGLVWSYLDIAQKLLKELDRPDMAEYFRKAGIEKFKTSDNPFAEYFVSDLQAVDRYNDLPGNELDFQAHWFNPDDFKDNQPLDWASFRGKVVLICYVTPLDSNTLNLCDPETSAKIDELKALWQKYGDAGLEVVLYFREGIPEQCAKLIKEKEVPWRTARTYSVRIPSFYKTFREYYDLKPLTTILVGKDGKVVDNNAGGERLEKELEELFPARNPDLQRGGKTAPSATRRVLQERRRHLLIPRRWFWR